MRIDRIAAKPGKWRTFSKGLKGGGEGVPPIVPRRSQFFNSPYTTKHSCFSEKVERGRREKEFRIKLRKEGRREKEGG